MKPCTILGAGAIGGLFACQLQSKSIPVQIALKPSAENNSASVKTITLQDGAATRTFEYPTLQPGHIIECLILATKTYQSNAAIKAIKKQIAPDAVIIVLQNGMGTAEWLMTQFPKANILAATTTNGAYRKDNGTIVYAGKGHTWLGPLASENNQQGHEIYQHWVTKGVDIQWDELIQKRLWIKLGINCAINPLTVIFNCKNGDLLHKPSALEQMSQISEEFEQVYAQVFGAKPESNIFELAKEIAVNTAENISSMRQDYLQNRPTEINAINGYLVNKAHALAIKCPANESAVNQIKQLTNS